MHGGPDCFARVDTDTYGWVERRTRDKEHQLYNGTKLRRTRGSGRYPEPNPKP